jgi:hypothetical protein
LESCKSLSCRHSRTCGHLSLALQVVYMAHDFFPSVAGKEGGFDRPLTALPYCEGDYWPGMAETFSQQIKDGSLVPVPAERRTNAHMEGIATALGPPLSGARTGKPHEFVQALSTCFGLLFLIILRSWLLLVQGVP